MIIFQIYAPTCTSGPKEIECFFVKLEIYIDTVPGQDSILIVTGDWNAKLGKIIKTETTCRFGPAKEMKQKLINLIDFR